MGKGTDLGIGLRPGLGLGLRHLIVVTLLCFLPSAFAAQPTHFNFNHLTVADGLIQGSVQAIAQDRHGFMWFGTQQGLSRYDGVEFKTYLRDPADPNSLPGDWIWDLHVDRQGNLWVGTHREGLALYDPAIDGFHAIERGFDVRQIAEDPSGLLWLAMNERGLATYNPETNTLALEQHVQKTPFTSKAVFTDTYSNVWVATDTGLLRRDPITHTYEPVLGIPMSVSIEVMAGDTKSLWIGTYAQGVFRVDISTKETQHITAELQRDGLSSDKIRALLLDQANNLWVGHDTGGLNHQHEIGSFGSVTAVPGNRYGLLDNHVRAIFQDRDGLVWVGTQNGITLLNQNNNNFVNFSEGPFPDSSLSGNWVSDFAEQSPSEFWVATYGGSLSLINLKDHTVQSFLHQPDDEQSVAEDRVMTVAVTAEGDLWAGTRDNGVSVRDASGSWRHYRHDPSNPNSLSGNAIADIHQDRAGQLWIAAMGGGVNRYLPEQDAFQRYQAGTATAVSICSNRVLEIYEDTDNALWFGTYDAGICRLDPVTEKVTHFRHSESDSKSLSSDITWVITEDKFGNLIVGTENTGLNIWLASDREQQVTNFQRFTIKTGLASNVVYGIEADSAGHLWVGSNRGLTRYLLNTDEGIASLEMRHFTVDDGLPGNEFNYGASLRASNGKILFGGTEGLTVFQPETQKQQRPAPTVALTEFRNMNEPLHFSIDQPAFTVEYDDKLIQFSYAALDYSAPKRIRYQHFLSGFDDDWVDDGNLSQTSYTNLSPGEYEFNVRAIREGDVWPDSALRIPLTVNPPIWATGWAYTSYLVLTLFLSFVVYRSWMRRLQQGNELRTMNLALRAEAERRQKQELALEQAQHQAEQYLEVAEVPIIALDEDGLVTMINQKGSRLIGLSENDIIGQHFASSFIPVDAQDEFSEVFSNIDQYAYSESRLTSSDGTERLIAWHNVRLSGEDTPANGVLMSGSDLTQMRKLESQLRDGQKMEALGTLARGVAHDFNNILSAILGYAELTRTKLDNQHQANDYLLKLEGSVSRAKEIVASVLTFGRAQQLPIKLMDLETALDDALHLVRPIIPANVRLTESIDNINGPVLANPAHITQIILNLCTNACQAMSEQGGELRIKLTNHLVSQDQARESGKLQAGPHALIVVEDTGTGMDDYTRARIFEPFFTTHSPGKGSGLGLSVVHGVVSQIGGTINVTSQPEQGTRFEITLPCLVGESVPRQQDSIEPTSTDAHGETILFVDDEHDVATIAELNLSTMGFSVLTAENGESALEILAQQQVNLVVTDQTMPGMRGEELATMVKRLYPNIPVILISGADQPEIESVDEFLTKPYTTTDLAAKIRLLLDSVT